jgi:hypothetical protein
MNPMTMKKKFETNGMELSDCLQQIQKYLENSPAIILGSGSSAAYGLPLMNELRDELRGHRDKFDAEEFDRLCSNLDTMNLEEAIDQADLSNDSLDMLRKIVWDYVNEKDLLQFHRLINDKADYALADLLKIIIATATNAVTVITTNYDRLVEYAADIIGATAITGFEGNLIRALEFQNVSINKKRIRARERVVNIWKVHGSLDWFVNSSDEIVSFPLAQSIPENHTPLIIAPGKDKYSFTHGEPYRDVIAQADAAFSRAGSFLCIGYGFNDEHIQPKLIEQIKKGKPIVVLCRTATEACKQKIESNDMKYAIIERNANGRTTVTGVGYSETYDGNFWNLPEFVKMIWR